MSEYCFVIRRRDGLRYALGEADVIYESLRSAYRGANEYLETLSVAAVARAILAAALARTESIGSHYMAD
jgi:succinate dehydrogenase/fumarate reductase flavoprotein subunit